MARGENADLDLSLLWFKRSQLFVVSECSSTLLSPNQAWFDTDSSAAAMTLEMAVPTATARRCSFEAALRNDCWLTVTIATLSAAVAAAKKAASGDFHSLLFRRI